ncbi:methyltransferase domain-containing protein [Streptomyces sp. NPDC015232]|uniref:methyltransferase domain-containing protein n=1 Tax=unclassified Streptomyces TaxID=2593676 RepID=UPI0037000E0F
MTVPDHQDRPGRTELGRRLVACGALGADWVATFAAVDRAAFLPDVMWPFVDGWAVAVDRRTEPDAWYGHADADLAIVTQWDDGEHDGGAEPGTVPTSSSSQPSVVHRLLAALDADAGMAVLDAGTGTGETAARLAHRCGARNVTTVEVDGGVSAAARERLRGQGLRDITTCVGDALAGCPGRDPYDRLLCTFGVRAVPVAWLEQVRAGGVIVVPYGTHYGNGDAVVRLTAHSDGTASGRFMAPVEFMKARSHRLVWPDAEAYVTEWPAPGRTWLRPGEAADATFVLSHAVPAVAHTTHTEPDGVRAAWFYSLTDHSWAAVRWPEGDDGPGEVHQQGPRRLWDSVERAYAWWEAQGRPEVERFGLTVTPYGSTVWLDEPGCRLPGARAAAGRETPWRPRRRAP